MTTTTVAEMLETHNMLRADTTALFERLREANIMLQEVLSGSHENMSALENTLMLRVSDFVTAMNEVSAATGVATDRVERNITNFRDVTTHVITDLGQLAVQFDAHGRDLAKAAELVDSSNQRSEDTINERRVQLDSLVSTLDIRTEDLEQRLKRFSGLLDESLEAASARARDVARVVSEASAEGSRAVGDIVRVVSEASAESARAIGEQYDRVRENAEDERRRAAEAMRTIYEQSAGDTQSLFNDANERFAEAVAGMKQMAAEMQRELEQTRITTQRELENMRQQMAREFELHPHRTAPRRVRPAAGDRRQRRADAPRHRRPDRGAGRVEPHRRPPRPQPRRGRAGAAPRRAHARHRRRPPRCRAAAPRIASRTAPGAAARDTARTSGAASGTSRTPAASHAQQRTRQLRTGRAPRRAERRRSAPHRRSPAVAGSPICSTAPRARKPNRRANIRAANRPNRRDPMREPPRAPEERTARHSIESLDSLSVDIARMIDHDAAADLWDRYKRGERNVFTRRLYTLQGQQAFDEIRKKYRGDREFKLTVDRYIGEFERLLDEVSRDDRGQVVARTYLTSETGKVYTMLAHAAGRFD